MKWILFSYLICTVLFATAQDAIVTTTGDTISCTISEITVKGVRFEYIDDQRIIALSALSSIYWRQEWRSDNEVRDLALKNHKGIEIPEKPAKNVIEPELQPIVAQGLNQNPQQQAAMHLRKAGTAGFLQLGGSFVFGAVIAFSDPEGNAAPTALIFAGVWLLTLELIKAGHLVNAGRQLGMVK